MNNPEIFGLKITIGDYQTLLQIINNKIISAKKITVHNVNAYIINEAIKNKLLYSALNEYSFLLQDGIAIFLALKILGFKNIFRNTGTDLHLKILDYAQNMNKKVFFYGGSYEAKNRIKSRISSLFPNLTVVGVEYGDLSISKSVINRINELCPDILFIGLGTPKQELWILENKLKVNVPLIISVGSGIEFLAGTEKRAPIMMQRFGLEWLYRMVINPRRLWKRYLLGIPEFFIKVFKYKFWSKKND